MDAAAIVTIVTHMQGRSFYSILKAMFSNTFVELKAAKWNLEIDGEAIGRAAMNHDLLVDDVLGIAYESWAWTQKGQAHVIHINGDREGHLTVAFDGGEVQNPVVEMETRIEGDKEQTTLLVHVKFDERHLIFEALLD